MKIEIQQSESMRFYQLSGRQAFKTRFNNLYIKLDKPSLEYNSVRVCDNNGNDCFEIYHVDEIAEVFPVILKIETD